MLFNETPLIDGAVSFVANIPEGGSIVHLVYGRLKLPGRVPWGVAEILGYRGPAPSSGDAIRVVHGTACTTFDGTIGAHVGLFGA